MAKRLIYYNWMIESGYNGFRLTKELGGRAIFFSDLTLSRYNDILNQLDDADRYRWYWYNDEEIYVRFDYKERVFDRVIKMLCLDSFLEKESRKGLYECK